ncbi:unnamed protein product [Schistocephalus solidus]|uniref:Uncharacterized protein n=1 Tax=Schistocephalus solidus TaxID=70667 RepID=A0A183SFM6_SCHSO|nr:unnamed protein product [Schistocephalus solidus]
MVVMHQPPPSTECSSPQINVKGAQLKNVEKLAYLGSPLTRNMRINQEVAQRISKVSQAIVQLHASMWNHQGIHLNTKLQMYKVVVLTTLIYGVETCTVYSNQARMLNHFYLSCFRRILKLRWQDRVPDMEVLERTGILSIQAILKQAQWRWSGHLVCFLPPVPSSLPTPSALLSALPPLSSSQYTPFSPLSSRLPLSFPIFSPFMSPPLFPSFSPLLFSSLPLP